MRAVEQSTSAVIVTNVDGRIEYVNPHFTEVTGYTPEEVLGRNPSILKSGHTPPEAYRELWNTLLSGKEWRGEFHNKRKDGTLLLERAVISAVKGDDGRITHFLAIKEDVTELKKLEAVQERMRVRLQQAQRLETLGTMAAGIAHEFNNILAPIFGYAEMAMMQDELPEVAKRYLGHILTSAERARALVEEIHTFGRGNPVRKAPIHLDVILKESIKMMRDWIPGNLEIRTSIPSNGARIMGNPAQIHQILIKLASNAMKAMARQTGVLEITLTQVTVPEKALHAMPRLETNHAARLVVRDNGRGMTPEVLEHVFDPFYTTFEDSDSQGMGLSVVHALVNDHGGDIQVRSTPGEGTETIIHFPIPETRDLEEIFKSKDRSPEKCTRILVVDDESTIRTMLKELLNGRGHDAVTATNGKEALEIFQKSDPKPDLIITDKAMPEMSGLELAAAIRKTDRRTPILVLTGFGRSEDDAVFRDLEINKVLHKPITAGELLDAVHDLTAYLSDAEAAPE